MKRNSSFDRAMDQIVAQAEAERVAEVKAKKRAEWFGRIRLAFVFLFIATVAIFTYNFHDRFGELVAVVMPSKAAPADAAAASTPATPQGKASAGISTAQQNAAARDALVDQLSSGNANK
jgi:hypothetical protein